MPWEENRLVLFPQIGQEPFLIQAQTTEHQRALTTPLAVIVRDSQNEGSIHLVFLRPEHKGWDAAGSLSGVQSRAALLPKASVAQLNAANIAMPKTKSRRVCPCTAFVTVIAQKHHRGLSFSTAAMGAKYVGPF